MTNLSLLLLLLLLTTTTTSADDSTAFIYVGCSQSKYTLGTPYQFNVDSLLSSLANAATFSPYSKFTSSSASPSAPVYGLFQCRGDISLSDCSTCVRSSLTQLSSLCPSATGAVVQLSGCFLRYGNDSFLGKPDTTLLYKKCGSVPSGGYDSNLLSMRDDSLAAAQASPTGSSMFKVGAAGNMQAEAQCVGDLTAKDCADCVSSAVGQLKGGCGFALSGDAYLGKCYARYWSNGVHHSSGSSKGDDAGKTLAIIIGLMAGVALIIIFLSFLRRVGGSGKY